MTVGALFVKGSDGRSAPRRKIALSLLTWNTRDITLDAFRALLAEARMLTRLGIEPLLVACDNGSTDGTPEGLRALAEDSGIPFVGLFNPSNRGISAARNQIIDVALEAEADFLLLTDGDVEVIPFSIYALARYLEDSGHLVGGIGPALLMFDRDRSRTTPSLFHVSPRHVEPVPPNALTHYALYRVEVFAEGVRFDEAEAFNGPGWGFEDVDLGYQMLVRGCRTHQLTNARYLHRDMRSSWKPLQAIGVDPWRSVDRRRAYLLRKWASTPKIANGPLRNIR